ncbi:Rhodanese-like protein [Natrinema pellirubrum DSM 15624]|uniref:Rhodanese-like protein n=1 Tax=Natrinema pellirubrum (strain DSM 15624 / CIP 106293 / JCM 10476 / NCIMB 786 / 157) TaxID=797303 RepID=L0JQF1_NATP1|nr:rhodanese-like domain-containing protein [Natrinema pellirubrum]AGB33459.1 Rhodanese-related sulfurtransferase [Natrinema pellirubrum DSM 15624]ELY71148.1 Rhodanese-like protein [Natrinema pellirubrum DSM 15624]
MVEEFAPETVRERIENDEEFDLIDIRDDEDYAEGHLPEAEHLTIDELEDTVVDRDWADDVVVYCYIGQTSVQAARLIEEYGDAERVASMAGGYDAWEPLDPSAAD